MSAKKSLSLIFRFYSGWYFFSIILTAFCLYMVYKSGLMLLGGLLWTKALGYALIIYWHHKFKSAQLFYYRNRHFSPKFLWVCTIVFDFIIFISLSLLINYWR